MRATGLTPGAHDPDEDERLDAAVFTLARGEIADVKTAYALAMLGV